MKRKYRSIELVAFAIGALMFGIAVYFYTHPGTYVKTIFAISDKLLEKGKSKDAVSYSVQIFVQPDIDDAPGLLKQHTETVDNILRKRMQQVGYDVDVTEVDYTKGILAYKIDGVTNKNALNNLLSAKGEIKFCSTYEATEIFPILTAINEQLRLEEKKNPKPQVVDSSDIFANMVVGDSVVEAVTPAEEESNPLFVLLSPSIENGQIREGCVVGYALQKDMVQINALLSNPATQKLFPLDLALQWGATPLSGEVYALYAVKTGARNVIVTGRDINTAEQTFEPDGGMPEVSIVLRSGAAARWADATAYAASQPVKGSIAVLCDDKVLSAPRVQTRIDGGRMSITGSDLEEAKALSAILSNGVLPNHVILKLY